jgi:DNA-binding NarL/FixJ family response regulator
LAAGHRTGEDEDRVPPAGRSATELGSFVEEEVEEETSWVDWQSALYLAVLGVICVFLAPRTDLWWLVPVLGVAGPVVLTVIRRHPWKLEGSGDGKAEERELLEALAERGEITPAAVAMHTSLTVDEAAKMLDELVVEGRLKPRTEDGNVAYSLPKPDRSFAPDGGPGSVEPRAGGGTLPERLDDPLSERELEVLALLASGRTNAEISGDLCVAVGTVKSHLNSIYRKLGAANRAEAITKAQKLNLLR